MSLSEQMGCNAGGDEQACTSESSLSGIQHTFASEGYCKIKVCLSKATYTLFKHKNRYLIYRSMTWYNVHLA